jgi:starch-binding outer membrane protein, SusD/RagB family
MKNSFRIITTSMFLLGAFGCEYMDEIPFDWAQPDDVFSDEGTYVRPVNQAYSYVKGGFNRVNGAFLDAATDDGMTTIDGSNVHRISRAYVNSSSPVESCWNSSYQGIRQALFVQKNLAEQTLVLNNRSPEEVEQIKSVYSGEMYALRALYEFDLLRYYGGYPIVDKYYLLGDPELAQKTRSSFAECVSHIVNLCDSAVKYLDLDPFGGAGGFGRMTRGAALAIKAKALVYSASPLFNQAGNANPLTGHVNPTADQVRTRWEQAAEALAAVINLARPTGAKRYSLFNNYERLFITSPNDEYIVFRADGRSNGLENRQYPPSLSNTLGGGTVPTQEFVDAFTMADGTTYERGNPEAQYGGRDPRFNLIVGYNGSSYGPRGTIYTKTGVGATTDALNVVRDRSTNTGYYLRKFIDTNVNFSVGNPATAYHLFPIIRLADILLLYAEAMNEAYGIDADPRGYGLTARGAVQMVRSRAGFTGTDKYLDGVTTREQMLEKIKDERRIELAFEEHRYFDLRRWMDAASLLNQPVSGVRIEDDGTRLDFSYFVVDNQRKFDTKMYLHPIPLNEIKISPNLVQNPGW